MTITIRVDGGKNIGMGHLMRTITIANELRRRGVVVNFISSMQESILYIQKIGFEVFEVEEDKRFTELEIDGYDSILDNTDILILDSYDISRVYMEKLKSRGLKLVYIDDLYLFEYPVDLLINYDITGLQINYEIDRCKLLLGPRYALLREEFCKSKAARKNSKEVSKVLITTGGSDPYNMSYFFANCILKEESLRDISIDVIIGPCFDSTETLLNLKKDFGSRLHLHENVSNMSTYMNNADICISSGGSTLYELCSCGVPTLSFIMADNQEPSVKAFASAGYIYNLGWWNEQSENSVLDLVKQLKDISIREKISEMQHKLFDGGGVARVVKEILSL